MNYDFQYIDGDTETQIRMLMLNYGWNWKKVSCFNLSKKR